MNTRFESLMDVAHRELGIEVRCRCGRRAKLEGAALWRTYIKRRWDTRMHMVGDHLRCSSCGCRPESVRVSGMR